MGALAPAAGYALIRSVAVILLLFTLVCEVAAQTIWWDARRVSESTGTNIKLLHEGREVAVVDKHAIVAFVQATDRIGPRFALYPKVVVIPGNQPNAVAIRSETGEAVIGITPAMLAVVRNDADMVAVIVGHELAHLHLGHVDDAQAREVAIPPWTHRWCGCFTCT